MSAPTSATQPAAVSGTGHPPGASGPAVAVTALGWISLVLLLDADGSLWLQRGLGLATWVVLLLVLRAELPLVRVQTGVVVVVATAVEYTFSPLLEVYTYRFDNVPAYVPPGHGLVYIAALALGRSLLVRAHLRLGTALVLVVGGCWAAYGVTLADRPDVLGFFWFCCLAGFLFWGPSGPLYVGAFIVVSYLEVVGTALGTWQWQPQDPTGLVSIGNPPSGAAGGYGWFDLYALLLAGPLLVRWRRLRAGGRPTDSPVSAMTPDER
ncbi:MAG: hypothetical protein H0V32_05995 [Nocardioidaceae bacterium]|nr:hypothetical protein [Nocardioidaceae bacterium]